VRKGWRWEGEVGGGFGRNNDSEGTWEQGERGEEGLGGVVEAEGGGGARAPPMVVVASKTMSLMTQN
jgi:hypothetical protein